MGETSINNGVYNKNCASKYRDDWKLCISQGSIQEQLLL